MAQPVQQLNNQNDCATMSAASTGVFLPSTELDKLARHHIALAQMYLRALGKPHKLMTADQWQKIRA